MIVPEAEPRVGIKGRQAELDRFENKVAAILALVLTLTGDIYAVFMQTLL